MVQISYEAPTGWDVEMDDDKDDYKAVVGDELFVKTVRHWCGPIRPQATTKGEALAKARNLAVLIHRQQEASSIELL